MKKRKASQEEPGPHARKKRKDSREPYDPQLSSVDYEHIASYVQETLEGSMTAIMTSQDTIKATLDSKITELNILLQRAPQMQAMTSNVGTLWEDSTAEEGRM